MKGQFFRLPRGRGLVGPALVFVTMACAPQAFGASWFVTIAGVDSQSCGSTVDLACRSIQYAIDHRASNGDAISVGPGTYSELLTIRKNLTVQGPPDSSAIVDASHSGTVVTIPTGVTATLENLTIQNGSVSSNVPQDLAGGILNEGNLRLSFVLVIANRASTDVPLEAALAGGIVNGIGASLTMDRVSIISNTGNGGCSVSGGLNSRGSLSTNRTFFAENTLSSSAGSNCGKLRPLAADNLLNGDISIR